MVKRRMSVFERHRYRIAVDTLRMPDEILGVMGGMTKKEAERFVGKRRRK